MVRPPRRISIIPAGWCRPLRRAAGYGLL